MGPKLRSHIILHLQVAKASGSVSSSVAVPARGTKNLCIKVHAMAETVGWEPDCLANILAVTVACYALDKLLHSITLLAASAKEDQESVDHSALFWG